MYRHDHKELARLHNLLLPKISEHFFFHTYSWLAVTPSALSMEVNWTWPTFKYIQILDSGHGHYTIYHLVIYKLFIFKKFDKVKIELSLVCIYTDISYLCNITYWLYTIQIQCILRHPKREHNLRSLSHFIRSIIMWLVNNPL